MGDHVTKKKGTTILYINFHHVTKKKCTTILYILFEHNGTFSPRDQKNALLFLYSIRSFEPHTRNPDSDHTYNKMDRYHHWGRGMYRDACTLYGRNGNHLANHSIVSDRRKIHCQCSCFHTDHNSLDRHHNLQMWRYRQNLPLPNSILVSLYSARYHNYRYHRHLLR